MRGGFRTNCDIIVVKNGYIVCPPHVNAAYPDFSSTVVFETFEGLVGYLEKNLKPLDTKENMNE